MKRHNYKLFGFESFDEFMETIKNSEPEIRFVRFWTADMLGERQCDFSVPSYSISDKNLRKGFDASSMYPERINESDKIAHFDIKTARVFPIVYKTKTPGFEREWREIIVFGDVVDQDNKPYVYDSRSKLKQVIEKAKKITGGDRIYLGPELEFFLFRADEFGNPIVKDGKPVIADKGAYFKGGLHGQVRKEVVLLLSEMGYIFEYDHHEVANSQHEIDVKYMDALDMADFVMLYRYCVKRVAKSHGLFASFMPKPLLDVNGSGMHVHQSIFNGRKNLFFDKDDKYNLSEMAYQYMAGIMTHAPEITLFTNQWINSYRRLVPGFEAPVYICWDLQNRSNLIRKPEYEPGNELATRLELRSPDPSCNPYLAFSLIISAGLKGIEEKYRKPEPSNRDVYHISPSERDALGIKSLPGSLEEAINLAENSGLVKEVLGERFLNDYIVRKRKEVEIFKSEQRAKKIEIKEILSDYEISELLPIL